jgi:hypothetical protein
MLFTLENERQILNEALVNIELKCLKCGNEAKREVFGNKIYVRCKWTHCRSVRSIWSNTIFERLKIKPEIVLLYARLWIEGMHPRHICLILNISSKTYTRIFKKMIHRVVERFYSTLGRIGGNYSIVEIDESKFGRRKYNRGHRVDGVWVLGAVERTPQKKVFLITVPNRSADTLIPILKRYIYRDSIIFSDCWRSYISLNTHFYNHFTVNHQQGFIDSITGVHTNTIEGTWAGVKLNIPRRCRVSSRISMFLIRYMLKKNYKQSAYNEFIKFFF